MTLRLVKQACSFLLKAQVKTVMLHHMHAIQDEKK